MAVSLLQPAKYGITPPRGRGTYYEIQLQVCDSGRTISRNRFFENADAETLEAWATSLVDEYLSGTLQDGVYVGNENCVFVGPDSENPYLLEAERIELMTTTLNHDTRIKDLAGLYNPDWFDYEAIELETLQSLYLEVFKTVDFEALDENSVDTFLTLLQISFLVSKVAKQDERFSNSGSNNANSAYFTDYSKSMMKGLPNLQATFQSQVVEYMVDRLAINIQISASLNLFVMNGLMWRTLQRVTKEDLVLPLLYPNLEEGNTQAVA